MNKTCKYCEEDVYCREACRAHYQVALREQGLTPQQKLSRAAEKRDWQGILAVLEEASTHDENGCWNWKTKTPSGYGRVALSFPGEPRGKNYMTHRLALFAKSEGKLPGYETVHHACANRACCNPDHLQGASQRENMAEMHERAYYKAEIAALKAEIARLSSLSGLPTNFM